jgi:hypothetical protein
MVKSGCRELEMNSCLHRSMNTGVRTQSQLPTRELQRSLDHIPPIALSWSELPRLKICVNSLAITTP